MNRYVDRINAHFGSRKLDAGEYAHFRMNGMTFECEAYELEGLGRLSHLSGRLPLSLMRIDSLIISPLEKDLPLMNIDLMKVFGNRSIYLELYDLGQEERLEEAFQKIKERYLNASSDSGSHWYDGIRYESSLIMKKKDQRIIDEAITAYLDEYLKLADKAKPADHKKIKEALRAYSHGLAEKGGPATDVFIKSWGKEKTIVFFDEVLFG